MARSAAEVLRFNGVRNRLPVKKVSAKDEWEDNGTPTLKPALKKEWEATFDHAQDKWERLLEYVQYFFMLIFVGLLVYCIAQAKSEQRPKDFNPSPGWDPSHGRP